MKIIVCLTVICLRLGQLNNYFEWTIVMFAKITQKNCDTNIEGGREWNDSIASRGYNESLINQDQIKMTLMQ